LTPERVIAAYVFGGCPAEVGFTDQALYDLNGENF
jgi:hypothetical protein